MPAVFIKEGAFLSRSAAANSRFMLGLMRPNWFHMPLAVNERLWVIEDDIREDTRADIRAASKRLAGDHNLNAIFRAAIEDSLMPRQPDDPGNPCLDCDSDPCVCVADDSPLADDDHEAFKARRLAIAAELERQIERR